MFQFLEASVVCIHTSSRQSVVQSAQIGPCQAFGLVSPGQVMQCDSCVACQMSIVLTGYWLLANARLPGKFTPPTVNAVGFLESDTQCRPISKVMAKPHPSKYYYYCPVTLVLAP